MHITLVTNLLIIKENYISPLQGIMQKVCQKCIYKELFIAKKEKSRVQNYSQVRADDELIYKKQISGHSTFINNMPTPAHCQIKHGLRRAQSPSKAMNISVL